MKLSFFQAVVVSMLLDGCTTWTPTKRMEKKLDGNYVMFWPFDPAKNAIQGDAPERSDTF